MVSSQSNWPEQTEHSTESNVQEAGIQGKNTDHSLRATGATTMFNAQVPEKMIKVTGHRSSTALAPYERPSLTQKQAVSKVLAEGESFDQEVNSIAQQQTSSFNGAAIHPTSVLASAIHTHSAHQLDPAGLFSSPFNGLTNCTVKFAPRYLNINRS